MYSDESSPLDSFSIFGFCFFHFLISRLDFLVNKGGGSVVVHHDECCRLLFLNRGGC